MKKPESIGAANQRQMQIHRNSKSDDRSPFATSETGLYTGFKS
jgi:hypothetical protein